MKSDSVKVMNVVKGEHAMPEIPIRFIGHPMIDVGVATLCAAAGVSDPRDLTPEAIDRFTTDLVEIYLNPAMAGFLSYVVFANARFANPAQLKPEFNEKRRAILTELVSLWKPDAQPSRYEAPAAEGETCAFSGDMANVRVSRMYIPMTTDEKNINFVPEGVPLMPISGWCLLALMVMPMGGLASKGKMWIVHSHDHAATLHFAQRNLERNQRDFQMQGLNKRPNYKFARTYLLRDLTEAQSFNVARTRYSLTAYLFSSSGQKSEIDIIHLPSSIIRFVRQATREVPAAWAKIVQRAEQLNAVPENEDGRIIYTERNHFYEELFDLPANAHSFLRRYMLRTPLNGKPSGEAKNDPRFGYSFTAEADLISWPLTSLFLKEVMGMNSERIEAIKTIGDRIAQFIIDRSDQRLFKQIFNARNDYEMRLVLLKADKDSSPPLFTLDEFVLAFFNDTDRETLRMDWWLARDLMVIRIIEKLHEGGQMEIAHNAVVEEQPVEAE